MMLPVHDAALTHLVGALYDAIRSRTPGRIVFTGVRCGRVVVQGDVQMVKVPVDVTAECAIAPQDAFGNPASVDGVPAWSLSDPTAVELVVSADGLTAALRSLDGALRTVQVQVQADADLGSGVKALQGVADVEFVAGEASQLAVTVTLQSQP